MPPLISWSELADATVGLWGLGVEGAASFRRLMALGTTPVLVEDAPRSATFEGCDVLPTAEGGLAALCRCDVVIKSPGISRYRSEVEMILAAGALVRSGLGLWLEEADRHRVACITGTKGKSTTTALATHLLESLGYRARAGGNIGQPPWDPALADDGGYWIIETSSFQVPDITTAPPVVVVTSLFPDHLDWHGSEERYYADKLSLCTKPGVRTVLAPDADAVLHAHAGAMGPRIRWVRGEDHTSINTNALLGPHNARNAALARALLVEMGIAEATDDDAVAAAVHAFHGLPSRCRSLGSVGGVEFVDDSLSTNVLPAQAALAAFADRRVALLVGGHDRGLDYSPLAGTIARRPRPTLVVTMPDNGPRIGAAVRSAGGATEVVDAADLADAVDRAFAWARPDGVVLLSPAAPSFGRFSNYGERARAFAAAAARYGPLR